MLTDPPQPARDVIILAYPGVLLLDIAGPADVFATPGVGPGYRVRIASLAGGSITASNGIAISTYALAELAVHGAVLMVPGGPGTVTAMRDGALLAALATAADQARLVASVCTGAFLLAAIGVLDGLRATTHWAHADKLARFRPGVTVDPDPIFIRQGRIWTSAGVTAGIDLALAIREQDAGRADAMTVARDLVVFLRRPGGQSQFSAPLRAQTSENPAHAGPNFDALHGWIAGNLGGDLRVDALAQQAGMSPRSFARVYQARTGTTPARTVATLRLDAARAALEAGMAVSVAAQRFGFGDADQLRRAFDRGLGVSPSAYRRSFSAPGARAV